MLDFCVLYPGESFPFQHAKQLSFFTDFTQPRMFLHYIGSEWPFGHVWWQHALVRAWPTSGAARHLGRQLHFRGKHSQHSFIPGAGRHAMQISLVKVGLSPALCCHVHGSLSPSTLRRTNLARCNNCTLLLFNSRRTPQSGGRSTNAASLTGPMRRRLLLNDFCSREVLI